MVLYSTVAVLYIVEYYIVLYSAVVVTYIVVYYIVIQLYYINYIYTILHIVSWNWRRINYKLRNIILQVHLRPSETCYFLNNVHHTNRVGKLHTLGNTGTLYGRVVSWQYY